MTHWIFKFWRSAWYLYILDSWHFPIGFTTENDSSGSNTWNFEDSRIWSILVLRSEHPHDICLHVKHVDAVHRACWKWFILGVVYYRGWMECAAVVRSITKLYVFHLIHHSGRLIWTFTWYLHTCQTCRQRQTSCLEVVHSRCNLL